MTDTIAFTLRYLAFIPLVLLISLLVHENAHLAAARRLGIRACELSIGFGPVLTERRLNSGLSLQIRWVPMGGFVRLDERDWTAASLKRRLAVISAGVCANLALASLLMFTHALIWPGAVAQEDVYVSQAEPDSPFTAGDKIVAMNNKRVDVTIQSAQQLGVLLRISEGADTTFIVRRNDELIPVEATPIKGGIAGVSGTRIDNHRIIQNSRSLIRATTYALLFSPTMAALTARGIGAYLRGGHAPEVTGVIGAAKLSGQLIELTGASYALVIAATLNFSIAMLNILPLPVLDGGRAVIAVIERARGRALNPRTIQAANQLSMALIVAVLTATIVYDLNSHIF